MKEFSDKKNIEMEKRKELLEGGKSIQANLAMYLRNKKEAPAEIIDKIFENLSEINRLSPPYEPDEAALKRMEALDLKEKRILDEIKSMMPDLPVAKLTFILPILEDSLKTYILNHPDQELQFRLDCIMTLFGDIYLVYRDSNVILQKAVDKVSDQLVEYNSLAGFRDYILKKLAEIRDFILDPTEENILSVCVNMSDVLLGYNAMVNYEIKS